MKTSRSTSIIFMGRRFAVPRGTKVRARPGEVGSFCVIDVAAVIDVDHEPTIYSAAVRMGLNIHREDVAAPGESAYAGLETSIGVAA